MKGLVPVGRIALLSMAALSMLLMLTFAPSAQAGGTESNERIQVAFSVVDCAGGLVFIEGTFHSVLNTTQDRSGGYHHILHNNHNLKGVSSSGATYTVTSSNTNRFKVDADSAVNSTFTAQFRVIARGENDAPDDFVVHAAFHVTQNANGELTATPTKSTSECR